MKVTTSDMYVACACSCQVVRPGDKLLSRGCSLCSPATGELGAFAMELLLMVDINNPRGVAKLSNTPASDNISERHMLCGPSFRKERAVFILSQRQ